MYRSKTVRELIRVAEKREAYLLRIIAEQNNRIQHLAGRAYDVTPREAAEDLEELEVEPEPEHEDPDFPGYTAAPESVGF